MPAETQYETYQVLFHENPDGSLRGRIRHDTSHVEQMPEQDLGQVGMEEALTIMSEVVMFWAQNRRLSHLPAPLLPFLEDRPQNAAAMVEIKVAYIPKGDKA